MPTNVKSLYDIQGFVVVPSLIPASSFSDLQAAAEHAIALTRSGKWHHRRTVGRQFPPFDESNPDSWGVQHVMHPDLGEHAFSSWYTSDPLIHAATELMDCEEDELQMGEHFSAPFTCYVYGSTTNLLYMTELTLTYSELFNMLINPESHDFALRWHRDDVRETATEEEEREALAVWHQGVSTAITEPSLYYIVREVLIIHRSSGTRLSRPPSI